MKKLIAILLSISLVFLIGCTTAQNEPTTTTKPTTQAPKEVSGFVEMNIEPIYLQNAQSLCSNDDLAVFMTTVYTDKDGNAFMPEDEDDFNNSTFTDYVVKYDLKKNKLINMIEIKDCPVTEIWGLELSDNHIIIYSDSQKKNAVFDMDMNLIEVTDRTVTDPIEVAKKSPFFNDSRLETNAGYSSLDGEDNIKYTYYHDDLNSLYIYNTDIRHQISHYSQNEDLFLTECFDYNGGTMIDFRVEDFRNAKEINRATIDAKEYNYDYCSTGQTSIGNKYAICTEYFNKNDSNDYTIKMFSWNYNVEATNEKLDIVKLNSLDDLIEEEKKSIKDDYNIDVHINDPCENIIENVNCDEKPDNITLYDNLHTIHSFLDSLPDGMINEIHSGYENDKEYGIRIDLVSEITFEAGAFAQSFTDPMEVCFPFNGVHKTNIAHEFMHLIDERILQTNSDLLDKWDDFNKGFEHDYDPNEETHPSYNFDEKQFISDYAATNSTEERAEIFAYLYTGGGSALKPKAIKKKAEYLIMIISDTYPSIKNAKSVCWEQNIG